MNVDHRIAGSETEEQNFYGMTIWNWFLDTVCKYDPRSKLTPSVTFSPTCQSNDEAILGGCSERWKSQIEQTSNPTFQLGVCSI